MSTLEALLAPDSGAHYELTLDNSTELNVPSLAAYSCTFRILRAKRLPKEVSFPLRLLVPKHLGMQLREDRGTDAKNMARRCRSLFLDHPLHQLHPQHTAK